jgi:cobalt-zinc-cadmium efflux system protein
LLVVWAGWGLLADAAHVLMEGTPEGIDPAAVASAIEAVEGVDGVHHLHVWNLASDVPALSAHVLMDGDVTLHEGQRRAEAVKARLAEEFGIEHATLEIECHECPSPQGDDPGVRSVHGRAPGP